MPLYKGGSVSRLRRVFYLLIKEVGDPVVEFELPDWFNRWKPTPYTSIRRNIYLTKKIKKRLEDDGIFCSCCPSPGSSIVCGRDCHCGMLLSSCSSGCKCGSSCSNKPFQNRPMKKMKLIQTEKCGAGIVADQDIKKGEFVIEYVGEIIDDKTCEERLWEMKHRGETNFYLCEINRDMVIDATYKGNKSRYINHSCSPNTEMQKWIIDGETRIGIFATRDIKKGEHLTYDYQFVQFGADQDCHCGAVSCRRKLGAKPAKPKISSEAAVKVYQNGGLHAGNLHGNRNQQIACSRNCIGEVIRFNRPGGERLYGMVKRFNTLSGKHAVRNPSVNLIWKIVGQSVYLWILWLFQVLFEEGSLLIHSLQQAQRRQGGSRIIAIKIAMREATVEPGEVPSAEEVDEILEEEEPVEPMDSVLGRMKRRRRTPICCGASSNSLTSLYGYSWNDGYGQ
ncbi:hypothetical protein SAY87_000142 [Trapa incisa]|uniref:Histone-lysine N-methyltransferase ASHH3 n=1 Tax=Trapa incisa TaxID=236973 RepID=A0AAN7GEV9_9MYRT|nr:hypothetical protein SAY87_000142 [Trapa incisa]